MYSLKKMHNTYEDVKSNVLRSSVFVKMLFQPPPTQDLPKPFPKVFLLLLPLSHKLWVHLV